MSNIVLYIIVGLLCYIAGVYLAPAKIKNSYTLRKLKNKQKGTDNESNFIANIIPEENQKRKFKLFRRKRNKKNKK